MTNKIFGRIYKITNKINGKLYIGQTIDTIESRFNQHVSESKKNKNNMLIGKAIKKYGKQNFEIDELDVAYSQQELNILEGTYINLYKTLDRKIGYNIKIVDLSGVSSHHEETKKKIRKRKKGQPYKNSTSKYVGVCLDSDKWQAYTHINGKQIKLGFYESEIEAAQARDMAELKYLSNEAILNFPDLKNQYLSGKINPQKRHRRNHIRKNKKSTSNIVGVSYHKSKNRWRVYFKGIKDKMFKTQIEAESYALTLLSQ